MQSVIIKKGVSELATRISKLDAQELTALFEQLNAQLMVLPKFSNSMKKPFS
jgi:hypothetical protein